MALTNARLVSGRYSGAADRFAIELRIDVDGHRPTRRISADYYRDGRHFGSMRVDAPRITIEQATIVIVGRGSFSWRCLHPNVRVTIPRVPAEAPAAPASFSHFTSLGAPAAVYTCDFDSSSFRSVMLYQAREEKVTPFSSYDTASLPCRGPRRELSLQSAYGEAGIELVSTGDMTKIAARPDTPADDTWSDAELQAAMNQYFSQQDNRPQWAIWLLHAWSHDDRGIYGLMFDRRGLQRQGCAVFYAPINGPGAANRREQLHTCVHEVGHGFNLMHSWQRSRARPPVPGRPAAATWMNYPQRFPGGPAAFWPQFPFHFDDLELAHLRHGFEEDVIMGGSPFGGGPASTEEGAFSDERISRNLRMRISAPPVFGVGVPVTIGIELASTTEHSQTVPVVVGPRAGNVSVTIRRPDGKEVLFEPLLMHCHGEDTTTLSAHQAPRRDFAYLHYGKDGFAFERPGSYAIRAHHVAADGSTVRSNVLSIEVRPPVTREDRELSKLVAGNDDLGALMSLSGSLAPAFDGANDTLDEVIERYPSNEMASIARVVRATSLARPFKVVAPGEAVRVRPSDIARAESLIKPVLDLPTVYGEMSEDADVATQQRTVAATLVRIGTREGVSATVDSFVSSRRLEIAGVISSPQMTLQYAETDPRVGPRQQASPQGSTGSSRTTTQLA